MTNQSVKLLFLMNIGLSVACFAQVPDPVFCHDKYSDAAQMVDASYEKYGTLYSGGEHWHQLDHVGATVDLYRLWRGLPDLKLRNLARHIEIDPTELKTQAALEDAMRLGDSATKSDSSRERLLSNVTTLDLMTSVAEPKDWWRHYPLDKNDASSITANSAKQSPLLDWLQFVLVASDIPQQHYWHWKGKADNDPSYDELAERAWAEYQQTQGVEWFLGALLYEVYPCRHGNCSHRNYAATLSRWKAKISTCEATNQEYAAFSVAYVNVMRLKSHAIIDTDADINKSRLPKPIKKLAASVDFNDLRWVAKSIRKIVAENYSMQRVVNYHKGNQPGAFIAAPYNTSSSELAKIYLSASVEDLSKIDFSNLDYKAIRALNLLSADNLLLLSRAPKLDSINKNSLIKTAFRRYFALGQDQKAFALINEIKSMDGLENQLKIAEILAKEMRMDQKMALIALVLREKSAWLNLEPSNSMGEDIALETWFANFNGCDSYLSLASSLAGAQSDLDTWLLSLKMQERYRGMHGYTIPVFDKMHMKQPYFFNMLSIERELPFSQLIASTELDKLGENEAYVRRVSSLVIEWAISANSSPSARKFRELFNVQSEEIPEALHRVVMISKSCPLGEKDDNYLAQLAFETLHRYYPNSVWSIKTYYWWQPLQWWRKDIDAKNGSSD
jgi:hypothetical protein